MQGVFLLIALGGASIAEQQASAIGLSGFHKRTFAYGLSAYGKACRFSFHNSLSKPTRKAIAI
jgi:hypothetical protein